MIKHSKYLLIIICCLFFLTGCSTKFLYNHLDIGIRWYVKSYISLDRDQKKFLREHVDEFHDWHRKNELPRYADFLGQLIERLNNPSSEQSIHDETDRVQNLIDNSIEFIVPTAVELLSSLSDEQVDQLLRNVAKDQKDYQKKYVDVAEEVQFKERYKEFKKAITRYFGRLSKEQKSQIRRWSEELMPYETATLKQQEISIGQFTHALENREDTELLENTIRQMLFYRSDEWIDELQDAVDYNQQLTYELMADLINNQSQKQNKKMISRLDNYRVDFIELAEEI